MATSAAIKWRTTGLSRLRRRSGELLRVDRTAELLRAEGVQLGEGAFVAADARLAPPCHADPGRPWLIAIGADSFIDSFVTILTHDGSMFTRGGLTRIGRVDIGSRVYVGPGAMILPGSEIGDDSIIETGAVVRGRIPPESLVAGNPATVISDTRSLVEQSRRAVADGTCWPHSGWSKATGITKERRQIQREALSSAPEGFLLPANGRAGFRSGAVR